MGICLLTKRHGKGWEMVMSCFDEEIWKYSAVLEFWSMGQKLLQYLMCPSPLPHPMIKTIENIRQM